MPMYEWPRIQTKTEATYNVAWSIMHALDGAYADLENAHLLPEDALWALTREISVMEAELRHLLAAELK